MLSKNITTRKPRLPLPTKVFKPVNLKPKMAIPKLPNDLLMRIIKQGEGAIDLHKKKSAAFLNEIRHIFGPTEAPFYKQVSVNGEQYNVYAFQHQDFNFEDTPTTIKMWNRMKAEGFPEGKIFFPPKRVPTGFDTETDDLWVEDDGIKLVKPWGEVDYIPGDAECGMCWNDDDVIDEIQRQWSIQYPDGELMCEQWG